MGNKETLNNFTPIQAHLLGWSLCSGGSDHCGVVWCGSIISLVYLFLGSNATKNIFLLFLGRLGRFFSNVCGARFSVYAEDVNGDSDNSILAEFETLVNSLSTVSLVSSEEVALRISGAIELRRRVSLLLSGLVHGWIGDFGALVWGTSVGTIVEAVSVFVGVWAGVCGGLEAMFWVCEGPSVCEIRDV